MSLSRNNLPSISIVSCTWNTNLFMFEQVLKVIQMQNYPKKLIEHIVMDAGSINGTVELAKKYLTQKKMERFKHI